MCGSPRRELRIRDGKLAVMGNGRRKVKGAQRGHGGRRAGAGRPRTVKAVSVHLSLDRATLASLARLGDNRSEAVRAMVREYTEQGK